MGNWPSVRLVTFTFETNSFKISVHAFFFLLSVPESCFLFIIVGYNSTISLKRFFLMPLKFFECFVCLCFAMSGV